MVILITGETHTGKTALAHNLMKKYSIPYICLDHLKMGFIRSKNTSLTPNDDKKLKKCIKHNLEYILIKDSYNIDISL